MPDGISFCVHSFNEADELRRLVLSSLYFREYIDEWVILDHRSSDHTPAMLDELGPVLEEAGIHYVRLHEARDLSAKHTFADVRNKTLGACRNEIAALMDADFILGPAFAGHLERSIAALQKRHSVFYAGAYSVPVVWDRLVTDSRGIITDHGRVWVHQRRARILWRRAITYRQVGNGGRWEKLTKLGGPKKLRMREVHLTGNRRDPPFPNALISCNVKDAERIALRDTMTMFMEDAVSGKVKGSWLEAHRQGKTRSQGNYPYQNINLRGWRIHAPNLALGAQ